MSQQVWIIRYWPEAILPKISLSEQMKPGFQEPKQTQGVLMSFQKGTETKIRR